jgi:ATP-dependent DNA helicase PIF1
VAVASSGIAALLMDGGTTGHSRFKIPIPIDGDFRQVLPVVPKGTRAQIVAASIRRHPLWEHATTLPLTVNMRVQRLLAAADAEAAAAGQHWSECLLGIGAGDRANPDVQVPEDMLVPGKDPRDLVRDVFGSLSQLSKQQLIGRCILCPKNNGVKVINDAVTAQFPGEAYHRFSADSMEDDSHGLYPTELLNGLDPQGMPPHHLTLKEGMPVILIRNMDFSQGLANGTRLIVQHIGSRVIQAEVVTGAPEHVGRSVLIPRIKLQPADSPELPIQFTRKQFPLRPAFAMSINKSQGQTFQKVRESRRREGRGGGRERERACVLRECVCVCV